MKSFKSTWIFLVVVAAVVGLSVYQYLKDQNADQSQTEKSMLIKEEDKDLVDIRIQSKDSILHLVRDDKNWKVKEPVEDLADDSAAISFAESFSSQKMQETEKSGPQVDWNQYGFNNENTKTIDLKAANGHQYQIQVSGRNAFDGRFYVRVGDRLLLGENTWASILARESSTLRDKSILRNSEEPTEVVIQTGPEKLKLTQIDKKWSGPANLKLDSEKINHYVGELLEALADGVVNSRPGSTKLSEIIVTQGGKPTTITVFSRKSAAAKNPNGPQNLFDYFVEVSDRPVIYRLNRSTHEKLVATADSLRDKSWPFHFPLEQVSEVQIKTADQNVVIKKDGSNWKLEGADAVRQLDLNRLPTFFEKIKALEADEFLPANKTKGLQPEKNKIVMKNSSGEEVFSFVWGDEFSKGKDNMPLYYAKTNLSKEYMAVKVGSVKSIPVLVTTVSKKEEGGKQ